MKRVVYIHGIGEMPPVATLKESWDKALFGNSASFSEFAYWSDIERPKLFLVEPIQKAFYERMELEMMRRTPAFFETDGAMQWFTQRFVQDVYFYFFNAAYRQHVQSRLEEVLKRGPVDILIAHSLGSVAAFDVLSRYQQECKMLITMGSPLGLESVKHQIVKQGGRLIQPPSVIMWRNFADSLDVVAIDSTVSDEYSGRSIEDWKLSNPNRFKDGMFGPHSATGYLSTRAIKALVATWLQ